MKRLESLLTKAFEMKAHELWLSPQQSVRVNLGQQWRELPGEAWSMDEAKSFLTSHLSELDQHDFFSTGFGQGRMNLGGRSFRFSLQMSAQGIVGSFKWPNPESLNWESWNLPAHLLEVVARTRGLSLIAGPPSSGKSSLLSLLTQKVMKMTELPLVHFYSDEGSAIENTGIPSFSLGNLKAARLSSADIIVVDGATAENWEDVLNLSESGRHVVLSMQSIDLFSGMKRWNSFCEQKNRTGLQHLQMGMGSRLVKGLETSMVPAIELLLVSPKLRDPVAQLQWNLIEEDMKTSGDKTGMRTLNQSLLQLLLRRKIEMRTAFQESKNPDEFDHLLKKVGI